MTEQSRILVVEDEFIVALDLKEQVKLLGYSVVGVATTASQAIQLAKETNPDLILMDVRLGGNTDGINAAEQIRRISPIPIVYLTAFADQQTVERASKTEPFGYIIKPYQERDLEITIHMALYKSKIDRQLRDYNYQFDLVMNHSVDGLIIVDNKMRIIQMNPSAELLVKKLGYDSNITQLNEIGSLSMAEIMETASSDQWFDIAIDTPEKLVIELSISQSLYSETNNTRMCTKNMRLIILRDVTQYR